MEGCFEGLARLNAVYGVRLFRLCYCEFPSLHDEGTQREWWSKPASGSLERVLRTLDGILLLRTRRFVFCCSQRSDPPKMC
jgi:hypothetical protein